ncbi:UvrB/UvrC motif-containing protein [Desulfitobacterium metallireducens]|uniref:UvrB/UvrC protein n=1 Tax=Desulfitobacterium metallireducens DSM 15288 TaxID=871968 RepID=W0E9G1_9FIRM|nr:UvrB/UvrC motif-containing protein [Desulfitobacterium metallireducens]AHF05864.1 UvrB/UvrC protein [Desulfitobacterium metallireducens DSM 15288]
MLCQKCQQREANVQITKTINGKTQNVYLCEHCAHHTQEMNFVINPNIVPDFLQALFAFTISTQNQGKNQAQSLTQEKVCPQCGISFSQITRAGKLGCNVCYQTFNDQLEPLLRRIHGGGQHAGKIPARRGKELREKVEITKLKEKLQQLVQKEDFEGAVLVRDEIKRLEQVKGGEE